MNEAPLSQAFCDAVKAHPACASLASVLQWRVPEMKDPAVYPIVTFTARDVMPIGVGAYCTAAMEVRIEAQFDDETNSDTQTARANLLNTALLDSDTIISSINSAVPSLVRCNGYAQTGGGRGTSGRRWTSTLILRVGFCPA